MDQLASQSTTSAAQRAGSFERSPSYRGLANAGITSNLSGTPSSMNSSAMSSSMPLNIAPVSSRPIGGNVSTGGKTTAFSYNPMGASANKNLSNNENVSSNMPLMSGGTTFVSKYTQQIMMQQNQGSGGNEAASGSFPKTSSLTPSSLQALNNQNHVLGVSPTQSSITSS
jgi:hypothetical protein